MAEPQGFEPSIQSQLPPALPSRTVSDHLLRCRRPGGVRFFCCICHFFSGMKLLRLRRMAGFMSMWHYNGRSLAGLS